jgi:hypothetical protein
MVYLPIKGSLQCKVTSCLFYGIVGHRLLILDIRLQRFRVICQVKNLRVHFVGGKYENNSFVVDSFYVSSTDYLKLAHRF